MTSGINWDEVPPLTESGIDWSRVPEIPLDPVTPERRAYLQREQDKATYSPVASGHPMQRFAEGLGSFWPSATLGAQQAAASLGWGDEAALSQQAAEKERIDAPLSNTAGGAFGKFLPDLGLAVAGGSAGKPLGMIPQIARQGGIGSLLNIFEPKENYNLANEAGRGFLQGAAAEGVGQIAGRAALPFRKQTPFGNENAKILEEGGLPRPLISTQSGERLPQQMSDALEQIPILGSKVRNNRHENLDWHTRNETRNAGMEVPALTGQARIDMADRLDRMKAGFNSGKDSNAIQVISDIWDAKDKIGNNLAATGQKGVLNKFDEAVDALKEDIKRRGGVNALSAEDLMKRRSFATNNMHSADNSAERETYRAIRDAYDDAFVLANPSMRSGFEQWKAQYGSFMDVLKSADRGLSDAGQLLPKNTLAATDFIDQVARTPGERLRQASAQAITNPPTGWNRAGYIGMLMGAPLGMGGATALATNPTLGTAAGIGTAAALWNALSRKPISPSAAAMIERLTAGTTNAGLARMFGQ